MTVSVGQIRSRIAQYFTDVEAIDDTVIKFIRRTGDASFAVYYIDVADQLPANSEVLSRYQDRIIGGDYFKGATSLQWNYYLYFVRTRGTLATGEARQRKELIERDRVYARKFVISDEDLEAVLVPPPITYDSMARHTNVLSVWIDRLSEAGLEQAILGNDDLPTRLALIESSTSKNVVKSQAFRRNLDVGAAKGLRALDLKQYRRFPLQRAFEFAKVNLIFGANGTGKTSLLEAIELFYCGRNKRTPEVIPEYQLDATLDDDNHETATSQRTLQLFRNRNLTWYGQTEIKTNNLYQSFAQFNFLDTDAAASLADSAARIEDDLSKLLVGPDASKTWATIERVAEAVSSQLRSVNARWTEATEEVAVLNKQLSDLSVIERESDSLYSQLREMVDRVGWRLPEESKEVQAQQTISSLSELMSIVQQATGLRWVEAPASLQRIEEYRVKVTGGISAAESEINALAVCESNLRLYAEEAKKEREALELIKEAEQLSKVGLSERVKDRVVLEREITTYSGWLAGLNTSVMSTFSEGFRDASVDACRTEALSRRLLAQSGVARRKAEYAEYSKMQTESLKLAQQLRELGGRLIVRNADSDECPLCHTKFAVGDLAKHIERGVDELSEVQGRRMLVELQELDGALEKAHQIERGANWLVEFCDRTRLPRDTPISVAMARVEQAQSGLSGFQARLMSITAELQSLDAQGLSIKRLEKIQRRLRELSYSLVTDSTEAVKEVNRVVTARLKKATESLENEGEKIKACRQSIEKILRPLIPSSADVRVAFSELKERLATTESVQARLMQSSASCPWPADRSLAELAVTAGAISTLAVSLQEALGKEKRAEAIYTESRVRIERLRKRVADLDVRVERLTSAKSTFEDLQQNHSLKSAMEDALRQNRASIEEIFGRIHSPAEFSGLGPDWATLLRKPDDSEAKLSEISTGQRAAFALSIFLAQNTQVTEGPPIILIDDPIAHVDDLNALSFLDYLREVSLTGRRQIFFATASDKLATLFERKFDFLGEAGFRRINLKRDIAAASLHQHPN